MTALTYGNRDRQPAEKFFVAAALAMAFNNGSGKEHACFCRGHGKAFENGIELGESKIRFRCVDGSDSQAVLGGKCGDHGSYRRRRERPLFSDQPEFRRRRRNLSLL